MYGTNCASLLVLSWTVTSQDEKAPHLTPGPDLRKAYPPVQFGRVDGGDPTLPDEALRILLRRFLS